MKKSMHSNIFKLGLISLLATTPLFATASPTEQDDRAVSGTIVCGGNHADRLGGTEAQRTSYVWRNYNDSLSININRLTIYDANGVVLVDHDATTLPTAFNGVIGGGDNTLEPFQTALYRSADLLGAPLTRNNRPITTRIEWSAESKALIPEMGWVRTARRQEISFDEFGNQIRRSREDRARHAFHCRSVEANKGRKHDDDDD